MEQNCVPMEVLADGLPTKLVRDFGVAVTTECRAHWVARNGKHGLHNAFLQCLPQVG
jgi:hypothetical protein